MLHRITVALVALAILGGGGYGLFRALVAGNAEPPPPVATRPVKTADIEEKIVCIGEVEPELFTDIKSEVSGRVAAVYVVSGVDVRKGDTLIELDRSELESEIREAELAIEASRLRVEKAGLDYDAKKELAKKDFVSQRELADAEIDYKLAQNELHLQEAKLQTMREKLAKTVIKAPHDGVILGCSILEGMVITGATSFSEGTLLMQVAQLNQLRVNTDVNEVDVARVSVNMPVLLTFDSLDDFEIEGRVVFVSPSAERSDPGSSSPTAKVFPIIVTFSTDDHRIRPGMTAKVNLVLSEAHDVLAAELPSLFLEEGKRIVYVKRGASFERREVITGISDHDVVEIKEGLAEGDELALSKPETNEGAGDAGSRS